MKIFFYLILKLEKNGIKLSESVGPKSWLNGPSSFMHDLEKLLAFLKYHKKYYRLFIYKVPLKIKKIFPEH